ncbi:UNVERIFIED_CONTAM: hypothetical protein Slati_0937700 [Sesamum latifolium]|uniref:Transposase n=1 Tax=Sesamum latifolium TaxID=2727402 RepID=A0AAW2XW37_9LAMI
MIKDLGLSMEKIDACKNGCMLYWKDDIDLDYCKFCGEARYKPTRERNPNRKNTPYAIFRYLPLTPFLQRLYASEATAEQITWHVNHPTEDEFMCHPSDAEAWRHFNRTYPNFAAEPRNVRPGMRISSEYMFLMMVIIGLSNSKCLINVYLEPLIEELENLWHNSRMACYFDCHRQFLPADHPYRRNKKAFTKNRVVRKVARPRLMKLIPIAFHVFSESMWSALIEIGLLFQILCSTMVDVNKIFSRLENERKNKAHVEVSIVEAYLIEEIGLFGSPYFGWHVLCKRNRPRRNDDLTMNNTHTQQSIFNYPERASGASKKRWLSGSECHIIETYTLTNCEVVTPYYESFLNELYEHHHSEDLIIEELVATQFKDWFKRRVKSDLNYTDNELLRLHYWIPTTELTTFPCYFMNG